MVIYWLIYYRYESTDNFGGTCDEGEECIGGLPRTHYTIKQLLKEKKDSNVVFFNAGDSFQGTLWYNIGRYNVTSELLNLVPADAMVSFYLNIETFRF